MIHQIISQRSLSLQPLIRSMILLWPACCLIVFLCLDVEAKERMLLKEDANLRTGPGIVNQVIQPLQKETMVIAKDKQGNWIHVFVPKIERSGWIHKMLLKKKDCKKKQTAVKTKKSPAILVPQTTKQKKQSPTNQPIPLFTGKLNKRPPTSIAVLDVQKVIDQSKKGQAARRTFEELEQEQSATALAKVERELLSQIIMEIHLLVDLYAQKHHLSYIINKNTGSLFHYHPDFDITDEILQLYDQQR